MAILAAPTRIGARNNGWLISQQIYHFNTTDGTHSYVHFKTNVSANVEKIFMMEAEGYGYGGGVNILCGWGIYTTGGGSVLSKGGYSYGCTAHSVYKSSDNYACFVISGAMYYTGFVIHAYSGSNYTPAPISILAVNQNSTSGNYF